jgi:DNA-binding NarL/FixJ family response regulator
MLKIIVVDDSLIFKKSLAGLIENFTEFQIIGEFDNSLETIDSIETLKPDVLLLDIRLKNENGIDVLRKLKNIYPELRIIMITNFPNMQYRAECNRLGAEYFFDKSLEFENLVNVLQMIEKKKNTC